MTVFTCANLTKSYRKKIALNDVSLTLEPGRVYGLVGSSGAGKTTLLRLMTGLSYPDTGEMALLGESHGKKLRMAQQKIGTLVDGGIFASHLSAQKNLEITCRLRQIPNEREAVSAALQAVGLERQATVPVHVLTIGGKALLAVAAALLGEPEFLILDDPFAGLEPGETRALRETLRKLHAKGTTILLACRQLSQLEGLATDYFILRQGQLLETLSEAELSLRCDGYYRMETDGYLDEAGKILQDTYPDIRVEITPDALHIHSYHGDPQRITSLMEKKDIRVTKLEPKGLMRNQYLAHLAKQDQASTL